MPKKIEMQRQQKNDRIARRMRQQWNELSHLLAFRLHSAQLRIQKISSPDHKDKEKQSDEVVPKLLDESKDKCLYSCTLGSNKDVKFIISKISSHITIPLNIHQDG